MLQIYKITLSLLPDCQELRNIAQDPDVASTMNSQSDFAELKSHFFNHVCPCGNSDDSQFSYIEENGKTKQRECTKCYDLIGLDDSPYDEVLSWLGDPKNIRVSLCDCGNENPHTFVFEQFGDDIVLRCDKCRKTIQGFTEAVGHPKCHKKVDPKCGEGRTQDWVSSLGSTEACRHPHGYNKIDPKSSEGRKTKHVPSDGPTEAVPFRYKKIDPKSGQKLHPGDHVVWSRSAGYEHHAIFVQYSKSDYKYARIIHYTSPKGRSKVPKGKIVESCVNLLKQNGNLYRVEYKSDKVLNSDEVIKRARERLGEAKYNLSI